MSSRSEIPAHEVSISVLLAFLCDPRSYPDAPAHVETRETHMSRVFLTDHYAYKLKKAVITDFLDYSTPDARRRHCEAEIRLNRRLAASIYLGVVPICVTNGGTLQLGPPGEPIDWLVKMRRLPHRNMLDQALSDTDLSPSRLEPVINLLARFYRESTPVPMAANRYINLLHSRLRDNVLVLQQLGVTATRQGVDRIASALDRFTEHQHRLLSDRARRIVDGHGDLRPEHVFLGTPPAIIDCIEFSQDFRLNDPLDELAFLDMECRRQHSDWIGAAFIDTYCEACEDFASSALLAFYRARRALLRAKLMLLHVADYPTEEDRWHRKAADYLAMACREIDRLS